MELFLEFVVTIAVSFLFSFFLAKILSVSSSSTNYGYHVVSGWKLCKGLIGKVVNCDCVANTVEVDNSDESRQENILVEEILNNSSGSCDDDVKIDKRGAFLREVEGGDLIEKFTEEDFDKFGGACECEENLGIESTKSEKIAKFETDLTKDEVGVAKSEDIEFSGSECENEFGEAYGGKSGLFECEEMMLDKSNESEKIANIVTEFSKNEVGATESQEIESLPCECDNEISEANTNEADSVTELFFDEDDDWEGIERTELDRVFGAAVAYVGRNGNANKISSIGSDIKTQLYGLHKIATEGPCHEPQPMAFKLSARANWNAWKQLGNMSPEVAMEQYVTTLTRSIPGCIRDDIGGDIKWVSADAEACSKLASDLKTLQADQLGTIDKRKFDEKNVDELMPHLEGF